MNWKPIADLDRTQMQFLLVHFDGCQRLLLWNPEGVWEYPDTFGVIVPQEYSDHITHWMELPPNPEV